MRYRLKPSLFIGALIALVFFYACSDKKESAASENQQTVKLKDAKFILDNDTSAVRLLNDANGQVLFETNKSSSLVKAYSGEETVKFDRGSFQFSDDLKKKCESAKFTELKSLDNKVELSGKFNDCDLSMKILFSELAEGRIGFEIQFDQKESSALKINRTVLSFDSEKTEGFYGFGEQFSYFDMKGRKLPIWLQEQGLGRGLEPLSKLISTFTGGSAGEWHTTYTAVPYFLSNKNRAFYLENPEYIEFDMTADEQVDVMVFSDKMKGAFITGKDPLEIVSRYTEFSGRMKPLPDWTQNGAIVRSHDGSVKIRETVDKLKKNKIATAGLWIEDWVGTRQTAGGSRMWWNWILDEGIYPDWKTLVSDLKNDDIRILIYFNPFLVDDAAKKEGIKRNLFKEAEEKGYLVKKPDGSVYLIEQGGFNAGLVDFTNKEARTFLKEIMRKQVDLGVSGWMADFAEALPYDAVLSSGESAASYHNQYAYEWAKLNKEMIEEAGKFDDFLFFSRSAWTLSPGVSRLFWQGDQTVSWDEFDGIKTVIPSMLSSGLSGFSLQHSDVGGYFSISLGNVVFNRSKQLFQRWLEMNTFTSLLRLHDSNQPDRNHQWDGDEETLKHFSKFSQVFKLLKDYRKKLMDEAYSKGYPMMRHLLLHYPEDEKVYNIVDQFMLGSEILIAPVLDEDVSNVEVYFPKGKWVHLFKSTEHGSAEKGSSEKVEAPVGTPAVFFKKDSEDGLALQKLLKENGILD